MITDYCMIDTKGVGGAGGADKWGAYGEVVRPRRRQQHQEAVRITDARQAHSDDLDARISRYLISMLIRTVCVVLVVVIDSPWRWLFAVGAIGLPYLAVVMANTGRPPRGQRQAPAPGFTRSALPESNSRDAAERNGQ